MSSDNREEARTARTDIVGLFDIVKKQKQTIEKVENGAYDGGIKSYIIPKDDKQQNPNRETFPL